MMFGKEDDAMWKNVIKCKIWDQCYVGGLRKVVFLTELVVENLFSKS